MTLQQAMEVINGNWDLLSMNRQMERDPIDRTMYGAFADKLDEIEMLPELAFAFRWMLHRGKEPHKREYGSSLQWVEVDGREVYTALQGRRWPYTSRWAWYEEGHPRFVGKVYPVVESEPHKLPRPLIHVQNAFTYHLSAVVFLAKRLDRCMKAISYETPKETKEKR